MKLFKNLLPEDDWDEIDKMMLELQCDITHTQQTIRRPSRNIETQGILVVGLLNLIRWYWIVGSLLTIRFREAREQNEMEGIMQMEYAKAGEANHKVFIFGNNSHAILINIFARNSQEMFMRPRWTCCENMKLIYCCRDPLYDHLSQNTSYLTKWGSMMILTLILHRKYHVFGRFPS